MRNYRDYLQLAKGVNNLDEFIKLIPEEQFDTVSGISNPHEGEVQLRFIDDCQYECFFQFNVGTGELVEEKCWREDVSGIEKVQLTRLTAKERLDSAITAIKSNDRQLLLEDSRMWGKIEALVGKRRKILKEIKKTYKEVDFKFCSTELVEVV